jgi:sugar lactone lactonase YvrE
MLNSNLNLLYNNGLYLEGPRWHDGKLWFVDSLRQEVLTINTSGNVEKICKINGIAGGIGFLPGGKLIVTSMFSRQLLKLDNDKLSLFADLSGIAAGTIDDMIIDGKGRLYVGDLGFDLFGAQPAGQNKGQLILVAPKGEAKVVAENLNFPNGIAVSEDEKLLVVAESNGNCLARFEINPDGSLKFQNRFGEIGEPDGICFDADGCIWVSLYKEDSFVRINPAGNILDRIPVHGRRAVACVLGGIDRRTLFCISAETSHEDLMKGKSKSRIDAIEVTVKGAGFP